MSKLFVEKFNKEKELFSIKKVFRSVKKSGGSNDLAKKISNIIKRKRECYFLFLCTLQNLLQFQ